jgi:hypothetical protein
MRPNTMHAVFSPESCIFEGGHFYATSTMQDTMFAIVHTFINNFYTNADKPSHGILLRHIAWFYHKVLVQKQLQDDGLSLSDSVYMIGSHLSFFF